MTKLIDGKDSSSLTYRIELFIDDNRLLFERPLQSTVFVVDIDHHHEDDNQKIIGQFSVQLLLKQNSTTTQIESNEYRIRMISMINKNRLLQKEIEYLNSKHESNHDGDDEWIIISNEEILFNPTKINDLSITKDNNNGLQSFRSTAINSKSVHIFNDDYDDDDGDYYDGDDKGRSRQSFDDQRSSVIVGKNFSVLFGKENLMNFFPLK